MAITHAGGRVSDAGGLSSTDSTIAHILGGQILGLDIGENPDRDLLDTISFIKQNPNSNHPFFWNGRSIYVGLKGDSGIILIGQDNRNIKNVENIAHNGTMVVTFSSSETGITYGIINPKGTWISPPEGRLIQKIESRGIGGYMALFDDGIFGLLNPDENWTVITPPEGKEIEAIYKGLKLLTVFHDKTLGLLNPDETWTVITPPEGKEIGKVEGVSNTGKYLLKFRNKEGGIRYWLLNPDGTWVTPPEGKEIGKVEGVEYPDGWLFIFNDKTLGFLNLDGTWTMGIFPAGVKERTILGIGNHGKWFIRIEDKEGSTQCGFLNPDGVWNILNPPEQKVIKKILLFGSDTRRVIQFGDDTCGLLNPDGTWEEIEGYSVFHNVTWIGDRWVVNISLQNKVSTRFIHSRSLNDTNLVGENVKGRYEETMGND